MRDDGFYAGTNVYFITLAAFTASDACRICSSVRRDIAAANLDGGIIHDVAFMSGTDACATTVSAISDYSASTD